MNEQKNLLLAIVASLLILLVFQHFFPGENTRSLEENNDNNLSNNDLTAAVIPLDRNKALEKDKRVFLSSSSRLKGSVSLKAARIDDIILRDYKENINNDSPLVTLMSPKKTDKPYFAEFGWHAPQSNIDVPKNEAIWKLVKGKELSPENPVILEWISPDNLIFTRKISIDKNFLFTIEDKVRNNTSATQTLQQYGRIRRTGRLIDNNLGALQQAHCARSTMISATVLPYLEKGPILDSCCMS